MQLFSSQDRLISGRQLFSPTPDDLRTLILDYLCHSTYSNAAKAFVQDSCVKHLDLDGDEVMSLSERRNDLADILEGRLASGELRKEIRICILSGKVDQAAELLNKHFPSVLSESTESVPAHRPAGKIEYIPSTSVHPAHLALNLHILAFIEAARTVPLPYYPPGTRPPSAINVSASSSKDTDMMRHVDSEQANVLLLHRAQNLHSEAYRLPDANDRALYLTELTQVGGVLAYTVPERGPMAKYMTQERREAVADQIESAILYRTGQPVVSRLELCTRYTSVLWSALHDLKVKAPAASAWPEGVSLPGVSKIATSKGSGINGENATPQATKKSGGDEAAEIVPHFDLHTFLEGA
ncbi:hypothetical protein AcW1_005668 [Taiwanofungus camphoratus]|nr:hypothetical protein AcW2_004432 [Antrodia cinnamomea]KAI0933123.1 hypothetical protein AcV7_004688 [Antrodia cinnamomea]KAI0934004.1 hypothetical protein AcV5_005994 [Antrodia cinnamomea]KAI0957197.1 hypothetical protein AcW1_005668 [Antrodia cinnamomea]